MEYRIGEFAHHMGISTELLKHYEKLGLIDFRRDEANGYRYCDFSQCENILEAKALVTGRLTLKENAFNAGGTGKSIDAVLSSLEEIERGFNRELILDQHAIARTRALEDIAIRTKDGQVSPMPVQEAPPALYYLKMSNGQTFCERSDEELADFAQWRDCSPIVSYSVMRSRTSSPAPANAGVTSGLLVPSGFVEEYGLLTRFAERIAPPYFAYDMLVEQNDDREDMDSLVERCTALALESTSMTASNLRCVIVEHLFYAMQNATRDRFVRVWLLV